MGNPSGQAGKRVNSKGKAWVWLAWIPVLILAGVIFYSSSQPYAKQDLRPSLAKQVDLKKVEQKYNKVAFKYENKEISIKNLGAAGFLEFFIRKASHFSIYLLLAFFAYRAFRLWGGGKVSRGNAFVYTLLFAIVYAISDEFHQGFTGGRTPLLNDVIIDSVGAVLGILLAQAFAMVSFRKWR